MPRIPPVFSVETDLLFRAEQQVELASIIPDADLVLIPSQDGHSGFPLEFDGLNNMISRYLQDQFPNFIKR
jgi:homoserine O-acetyltransferase